MDTGVVVVAEATAGVVTEVVRTAIAIQMTGRSVVKMTAPRVSKTTVRVAVETRIVGIEVAVVDDGMIADLATMTGTRSARTSKISSKIPFTWLTVYRDVKAEPKTDDVKAAVKEEPSSNGNKRAREDEGADGNDKPAKKADTKTEVEA